MWRTAYGTSCCTFQKTSSVGSFTCACLTGWQDGIGSSASGVNCTDIDECATSMDNCHGNGTCTNTNGSFTCACNAGWSGDGITCADIDECSNSTHDCHANATCTNTTGSFSCSCIAGFAGTGVTCSNVNECTDSKQQDNCHDFATCLDQLNTRYAQELADISTWYENNPSNPDRESLTSGATEDLNDKLDACLANADSATKKSAFTTAGTSIIGNVGSLLSSGVTDTRGLLNSISTAGDKIAETLSTGESVQLVNGGITLTIKTSSADVEEICADSATAAMCMVIPTTEETGSPSASSSSDSWKSLVGAMGVIPSSSLADRVMQLLESELNPNPFAEGRQNSEMIAASRVPIESTTRSYYGDGRSPLRRLDLEDTGTGTKGTREAEEGESNLRENVNLKGLAEKTSEGGDRKGERKNEGDFGEEEEGTIQFEEQSSRKRRRLTSSGTRVSITLPAPSADNLKFRQELLEANRETYALGDTGGTWTEVCVQLDVQNERWTSAGCADPVWSGSSVVCECDLLLTETTIILATQYTAPPTNLPNVDIPVEGRASCGHIWAFVRAFIAMFCGILSFVGGLGYFLFEVVRVEMQLNPRILKKQPRETERGELRYRAAKEGERKEGTWKGEQNGKGRGRDKAWGDSEAPSSLRSGERQREESRVLQQNDRPPWQRNESGTGLERRGRGSRSVFWTFTVSFAPSRLFTKTSFAESEKSSSGGVFGGQDEGASRREWTETGWARDLLYSSKAHMRRLRRYFNPRRVIAFQKAQQQRLAFEGGLQLSRWRRPFYFWSPAYFRRIIRRLLQVECTLALHDLKLMRRSLQMVRAVTPSDETGYRAGGLNRQTNLWFRMNRALKLVRWEMGFTFDVQPVFAIGGNNALQVHIKNTMGDDDEEDGALQAQMQQHVGNKRTSQEKGKRGRRSVERGEQPLKTPPPVRGEEREKEEEEEEENQTLGSRERLLVSEDEEEHSLSSNSSTGRVGRKRGRAFAWGEGGDAVPDESGQNSDEDREGENVDDAIDLMFQSGDLEARGAFVDSEGESVDERMGIEAVRAIRGRVTAEGETGPEGRPRTAPLSVLMASLDDMEVEALASEPEYDEKEKADYDEGGGGGSGKSPAPWRGGREGRRNRALGKESKREKLSPEETLHIGESVEKEEDVQRAEDISIDVRGSVDAEQPSGPKRSTLSAAAMFSLEPPDLFSGGDIDIESEDLDGCFSAVGERGEGLEDQRELHDHAVDETHLKEDNVKEFGRGGLRASEDFSLEEDLGICGMTGLSASLVVQLVDETREVLQTGEGERNEEEERRWGEASEDQLADSVIQIAIDGDSNEHLSMSSESSHPERALLYVDRRETDEQENEEGRCNSSQSSKKRLEISHNEEEEEVTEVRGNFGLASAFQKHKTVSFLPKGAASSSPRSLSRSSHRSFREEEEDALFAQRRFSPRRKTVRSKTKGDSDEKEKKRKKKRVTRAALQMIREKIDEIVEKEDNKASKIAKKRHPMAVVAPTDVSRQGLLPLRNTVKASTAVLRFSDAKDNVNVRDFSTLTDGLLATTRFFLSWLFVLCFCLFVVWDETDANRAPRKPVTQTTSPDEFTTAGYSDLQGFLWVALAKSGTAYFLGLLIVGVFIRPFVAGLWSPDNTVGRLPESAVIHANGPNSQSFGGLGGWKDTRGAMSSLTRGADIRSMKGHDEGGSPFGREGSLVDQTGRSGGGMRLQYYDFGDGLNRFAPPVKLSKTECAKAYLQVRRQEVQLQSLLAIVCASLALLIAGVFVTVWLGVVSIVGRHTDFIAREHSTCLLLLTGLEGFFPLFIGIAHAMILRMSLWGSWLDSILNVAPGLLCFPVLAPGRVLMVGIDTVKALDGTAGSDWVVPPVEENSLEPDDGPLGGDGSSWISF
uniref:EGF-like domain-containing protein n=1 Tax=Chromera velia CCMP2878 TaxID=1169474 RepID=A0A0G4FFT6_9ALVE|eukprot:Cvel_16709.t1-p1 / transcript=Cvel_16709.t1 / gene=Cvel_16709 / organism=Chromera_velia_CCMP2878 / gene_product=Fibrillin-2, putative / transcript_product=Fibrillin-2, putative / location=Cvel_scaffold1298:8570-23674(-) / protein_length=1886 / sequence_SO=supercontig / SO=protein_coding / is_pseudo=false